MPKCFDFNFAKFRVEHRGDEAELMIEPAAAGSDDDDAFRFFVGGKQQRRLEIGEIFVSAVANGLGVRGCGAGERRCIH